MTEWLKAAAVRAVKTAAQTMVASLAVCGTLGEVDWLTALGTAGLAALLSLLTSVAGIPEVDDGTSPLAAATGEDE